MPGVATDQQTVQPTYTIVLIQHDGKQERELSIDQGTPEEVRAFVAKLRSLYPEILPEYVAK